VVLREPEEAAYVLCYRAESGRIART
jgi:hypothetical protein